MLQKFQLKSRTTVFNMMEIRVGPERNAGMFDKF
jgi:hypothetical protein